MGYAGNSEPSYIVPTVIGTNQNSVASKVSGSKSSGVDDLTFHIGDDAMKNSKSFQLYYPVRHGLVDNWTHMEQYWQHCVFKYLRSEPEDHHFLLVTSLFFIFSPTK